MWNPNPQDSKAMAIQILEEIRGIREDIIRLQEQRKGDAIYHQKLNEIENTLNDLLVTVRDNTLWIQDQKTSQEKKADLLASNGYGMIFSWLQALVTAIAIAALSWILTHQSVNTPVFQPPQNEDK